MVMKGSADLISEVTSFLTGVISSYNSVGRCFVIVLKRFSFVPKKAGSK